uniref:Uncharacterized protein n=1 Tax=Romanomermis culicivorax TaxID=13658 RepID=A0A915HMY8_ROMCU
MIAKKINMANMRPTNAGGNITMIDTIPSINHPSNSKDWQKKLEWASTLKRDQLQKEEIESQQPASADSERMIDEQSTSQQAEMASNQKQLR